MSGHPLLEAPSGRLVFDDDGLIVEANPQLHDWLSHPPGTLLGRRIDKLLGPAAKVFYSTHLFPLLKMHGTVQELYIALRDERGNDVPCLLNGRREDVPGGLNICAVMTVWRRKEFEEALLAARRAAEAATHAKDEFLAMVSHELRSPLSAILGWARLLRSGKLDATMQSRALESIERNADAQTQLIEDLLDVSRIVSGKLRLSPKPLELAEVIEEAVDTCRPAARAKDIEVHLALDRAAGSVYADPHRLRQIVWNLVSNAIKFTPKAGRVQVTLLRVGSRVRVQILDSGQGIPAADLPFLFERFWRAEHAARTEKSGLGLGLAITRSLVELHGGTIAAASSGPGQGSAFTVEFPLALDGPVTQRRTAPVTAMQAPDARTLAGVQVLVVDDDEDARTLLSMLLVGAGAAVHTAPTLEIALNKVRTCPPHVLLSDIGMGDASGFDLIAAVRADPALRRLPAVAITGMTRAQDRVQILQAGFQAHLAKPVEPSEVVALVASLTSGRD